MVANPKVVNQVERWIFELEKVDQSWDEIVLDLVRLIEADIIKMNLEQIWSGRDSDGNQIRPDYAESTKRIKDRRGDPYDRVTLKHEGDFYASWKVIYGNKEFIFGADDYKAQYLIRKYGAEIYGLTPDNVSKLAKRLKLPIIDEVRKRLFS